MRKKPSVERQLLQHTQHHLPRRAQRRRPRFHQPDLLPLRSRLLRLLRLAEEGQAAERHILERKTRLTQDERLALGVLRRTI